MTVSLVLKAANSQVVLRSWQYESKASAQGGLAYLLANLLLEDRYELATASYGRFCFNPNAGNSQVIGTSQMRAAEGGWTIGLVSVKAKLAKHWCTRGLKAVWLCRRSSMSEPARYVSRPSWSM